MYSSSVGDAGRALMAAGARRAHSPSRGGAVGNAPLILVADLAIEDAGVDLEHLTRSPASVAPELEDPQVTRLQLPDPAGT